MRPEVAKTTRRRPGLAGDFAARYAGVVAMDRLAEIIDAASRLSTAERRRPEEDSGSA
jgi:hypothetical protein